MKKRVVFIVTGLIFIMTLLSGCTKECEFFGCKENAALFKDYCKSHQKTMDTVDGIKDGANSIIDGIFGG
ncbi:MAG: hypothetical protein FWH08_00250 [Oscillospiraceae bacterium]|nr:hypothetical protein [Oscillospiraceae bacterium]